MADNIAVEAVVTPGSTFAADDISSVLYPRTKIALGADGSATDAEGGAGAVNAGTQRVTLASDDPAVAALQTIDNAISGSELQVDVVGALPAGDNNIGNVDIVSSALPTGAATLAEQQTQTTSLQLIDDAVKADYASFTPGSGFGASSDRVVVIGAQCDDTLPQDLGEGKAGALRSTGSRALHVNLRNASGTEVTSLGGNTEYSLGGAGPTKAIMAGVIGGDTSPAAAGTGVVDTLRTDANARLWVNGSGVTQPISAASLPLPSGAATEATLDARTGSLTETAPATDTASSGLNGRLQRIAQRLTSLIALLPASLGQKAKTASLAVVLASDQDALPITDNSGSLTVDNNGTFAVQSTIAAAATNIAKAEDVASANADVGVPSMAVRKATPANTSDTDGDYEFLQISAGRLWASVAVDTALPAGTNAIGKLAANTGVYIGDVGHGKTLKVASGTLTSDTDVIAAVSSKRIKVYAYSIISTGTNANAMIFKSNGTAGTELWRLLLQGAASQPVGANLALTPPGFLFATVAGEKLTLDVGNSDTIHYSIAYWDDDAT